jgi:hypothetical protein
MRIINAKLMKSKIRSSMEMFRRTKVNHTQTANTSNGGAATQAADNGCRLSSRIAQNCTLRQVVISVLLRTLSAALFAAGHDGGVEAVAQAGGRS